MLNSCEITAAARLFEMPGISGEHTMDIIPDSTPVCQFFFAAFAKSREKRAALRRRTLFFWARGFDFCCCSRRRTMMEFDSIKPFGVSRHLPETFLQRSCRLSPRKTSSSGSNGRREGFCLLAFLHAVDRPEPEHQIFARALAHGDRLALGQNRTLCSERPPYTFRCPARW